MIKILSVVSIILLASISSAKANEIELLDTGQIIDEFAPNSDVALRITGKGKCMGTIDYHFRESKSAELAPRLRQAPMTVHLSTVIDGGYRSDLILKIDCYDGNRLAVSVQSAGISRP